jgi:hypothetical protein
VIAEAALLAGGAALVVGLVGLVAVLAAARRSVAAAAVVAPLRDQKAGDVPGGHFGHPQQDRRAGGEVLAIAAGGLAQEVAQGILVGRDFQPEGIRIGRVKIRGDRLDLRVVLQLEDRLSV